MMIFALLTILYCVVFDICGKYVIEHRFLDDKCTNLAHPVEVIFYQNDECHPEPLKSYSKLSYVAEEKITYRYSNCSDPFCLNDCNVEKFDMDSCYIKFGRKYKYSFGIISKPNDAIYRYSFRNFTHNNCDKASLEYITSIASECYREIPIKSYIFKKIYCNDDDKLKIASWKQEHCKGNPFDISSYYEGCEDFGLVMQKKSCTTLF